MKLKFNHKIQQPVTKYLCLVAVLFLSSCANHYQINSNVNPENLHDYFAPTSVNIYHFEQEFNGQFKFIGLVEGQDCQSKSHHAAPDEINARTNARRNAYEQHANAIIFTGCALLEKDQASKQCLSTVVCYGKAYQVLKKS